MFIRKLAISNFVARKSRAGLTVAAVALSVSLVVAVTTGYASLFETAYTYLVQYMGSVDAQVHRKNDPSGVPWEVVEALRNDPAVRNADPRLESSCYFPDKDPNAEAGKLKHAKVIGIDRPNDQRIERLRMEQGKWFDVSTGDVTVLDQSVAEIAGVKVGDSITIPFADRQVKFKVVGIAHKPAVTAAFLHTVYVPIHTLQDLIGQKGNVSNVQVDLKDNVDRAAFKERWTAKFNTYLPPIKMNLTSEVRTKMDENLAGVRLLSYLGGAVSMLAATFIIFSALSMGVAERQRSLAMLRAVGAFKSQIAKLVIFEGMTLALAGVVIGVPAGWFWIKILATFFPDIFISGVVLSWGGVIFGVGGTLLTALVASLLPAWNATRVDPLEAMSPLTHASGDRAPLGWALAGAILVGVDPFLFFGPITAIAGLLGASQPERTARAWRFYSHFAVGLPAMFLGLFLLSPMCVWLAERWIGPLVAKVFGLRFALLRQQLSTGIWRAAGTAAALMVGLAVLIVMQVTGNTVIGGWQLPNKFPDVFIGTTGGLDPQEVKDLAKTPGLTNLMPIEIASVQFGGNPFGIGMSLLVPDATMFIGVDPDKVFDMMELDFHLGDPKFAKSKLKEGGWVVVTEEYRQLTHCKIGDPIDLGNHKFRIAAVVWSPGIDVMKGMYDMADQFDQRTISSVFGSIADGEKYFGTRPYVFVGSIDQGLERVELIKRIKDEVHSKNMQVGDVREIKFRIQQGFLRMLTMLSLVAYASMAVASLGVTNTVMAGVRTRQWQFGILRSIGVTRGQLLRLVLAEALLLGLIGCILGLGAGSLMSMNANALSAIVVGYRPPVVIPWPPIILGLLSVMLIALAASLWPAYAVARTEPLSLLQAGRASA